MQCVCAKSIAKVKIKMVYTGVMTTDKKMMFLLGYNMKIVRSLKKNSSTGSVAVS